MDSQEFFAPGQEDALGAMSLFHAWATRAGMTSGDTQSVWNDCRGMSLAYLSARMHIQASYSAFSTREIEL